MHSKYLSYLLLIFMAGCTSLNNLPVLRSGWDVTLQGTDLPSRGELVVHPNNPAVAYYHTILQMTSKESSNFGKPLGLWVTKDSGRKWDLILNINNITRLYVHPQTEYLYAVVCEEFIVHRRGDDMITKGGGYKIIMSKDGAEWKDISEGGGHMPYLGSVFADPDHSGRVCLYSGYPGPSIYQSIDDKYSHWVSYTIKEWEASHKEWNVMKCFPSYLPVVDADGEYYPGPSPRP